MREENPAASTMAAILFALMAPPTLPESTFQDRATPVIHQFLTNRRITDFPTLIGDLGEGDTLFVWSIEDAVASVGEFITLVS
jgi:hypothetical protein